MKTQSLSLLKIIFLIVIGIGLSYPALSEETALILPEDAGIKTNNYDDLLFTLNLSKNETVTLTLKDILDQVETRNLGLIVDKLNTKKEFYKYIGSYGNFLPSITGTYTHSRFQGGIQIFGGNNFKIYRTLIEPRAELSLPFQTGGRDIFLTLSSKNSYKAQGYQYEHEKQSKLREAAFLYYDIKASQAVKTAVEQTLQEAELEVERAKTRYETGVDIKLPVLQAETQLAIAKLKLLDTEKEIKLSSERLNFLLNLPYYIQVDIDSEEPTPQNFIKEELTYNELVAVASQNRRDLLQKEQEILAAKNNARSIAAEFLPTVNLGVAVAGSGPHVNQLALNRSIELFVESDILKNLGLNITARYKEAKVTYDKLKIQKDALQKNIEEQIATAFLNFKTAKTKINVAEIGLHSAEETYKHASGRYAEGVGDHLDVMTALTDLLKAKESLSQAIIDFNKAQIDILYQIGLIKADLTTVQLNKP